MNDKFFDKSGVYELICGEGRLLAHRQLGRDKVLAEVVTCTRKEALLQSLIENIARTKPGSTGVDARSSCRADEKWTIERVQQQLRRLCTTGYDLNAHSNRDRNQALYRAALHYFGSWRGALAGSGINLANVYRRRPKNLDRETMVLWLKERQTAGQSLVWTEVCLENRAYALAIRRTFRSWRKALVAAGLTDTE